MVMRAPKDPEPGQNTTRQAFGKADKPGGTRNSFALGGPRLPEQAPPDPG